MKNITLSIKESVERFAKVQAAKQGKSLSRFVNDLLAELMGTEREAAAWVKDFEAEKPYVSVGNNKFNRESLYDRKVLR